MSGRIGASGIAVASTWASAVPRSRAIVPVALTVPPGATLSVASKRSGDSLWFAVPCTAADATSIP